MYVFLKSPQKEVVHSKNYKAELYQSILDHQTTLELLGMGESLV